VVDSIQIFAGQRYSVVLNANQIVNNYWIRAQNDTTGGINAAILRYAGAPVAEPTTTSNPTNPMLETNLHPLQNPGAPGLPKPGGVDIALNLNMAFDSTNVTYSINGAEFIPPTVPVLLQILSGARSAKDLLPHGSVYILPPNKVIEISIPGGASDSPVRHVSPPSANIADESIICSIHSICMGYVALVNYTYTWINRFYRSILLMLSEALEALSITTLIQCAVAHSNIHSLPNFIVSKGSP
jgi:Multicopper oxidase